MKKPWNIINVPIYSISSKNDGQVNMNICTYVTSVSMNPKRYMVAVYHNTQTHLNISLKQTFVLQLLSEMQYGLVKNFGQKSGFSFNKQQFLERKNRLKLIENENPYATFIWQDFTVLKNAVALLLLKPLQVIEAGDHDMFLCDVVTYKNLNNLPLLTLDVLRDKKLVRI